MEAQQGLQNQHKLAGIGFLVAEFPVELPSGG